MELNGMLKKLSKIFLSFALVGSVINTYRTAGEVKAEDTRVEVATLIFDHATSETPVLYYSTTGNHNLKGDNAEDCKYCKYDAIPISGTTVKLEDYFSNAKGTVEIDGNTVTFSNLDVTTTSDNYTSNSAYFLYFRGNLWYEYDGYSTKEYTDKITLNFKGENKFNVAAENLIWLNAFANADINGIDGASIVHVKQNERDTDLINKGTSSDDVESSLSINNIKIVSDSAITHSMGIQPQLIITNSSIELTHPTNLVQITAFEDIIVDNSVLIVENNKSDEYSTIETSPLNLLDFTGYGYDKNNISIINGSYVKLTNKEEWPILIRTKREEVGYLNDGEIILEVDDDSKFEFSSASERGAIEYIGFDSNEAQVGLFAEVFKGITVYNEDDDTITTMQSKENTMTVPYEKVPIEFVEYIKNQKNYNTIEEALADIDVFGRFSRMCTIDPTPTDGMYSCNREYKTYSFEYLDELDNVISGKTMKNFTGTYEPGKPAPVIPAIITQPISLVEVEEGNISESIKVVAVATGNDLSYQWYQAADANKTEATAISGATNAKFEIPTDLAVGKYYYYCTVSVADESVESESVDSDVSTIVVTEKEEPEDPKPEDPTDPEDPTPEDPKPEDPKPEDPKPEDPKPEDPKPEDPKPEDPTDPEDPADPEDPTPEEPKPEEPKPEEPKPEEPGNTPEDDNTATDGDLSGKDPVIVYPVRPSKPTTAVGKLDTTTSKVETIITSGTVEEVNKVVEATLATDYLKVEINDNGVQYSATQAENYDVRIDNLNTTVTAILTDEEIVKAASGKLNASILLETEVVVIKDIPETTKAMIGDATPVGYQLKETVDISLYKVLGSEKTQIKETSAGIEVTMELPESIRNEKNVKIIRVHNEGTPEEEATVLTSVVNGDGTITFITDKFSTYAFVTSDMDLSAYSNFGLEVYHNSRVISVENTKNGFDVFGYMWIDYVTPTKNTWREIIFVNTEDASTDKAYRVNANAVYNTFLNTNMYATRDGKVDLSYACYKANVNTNSISSYDKKSTGKMASGTYYAFMRISDGTNSYLFPLVDRVLSDGSTLTLPANFSLSDDLARTLIYTVK